MPVPLNIAHRGGAQLWPENTLPAFISAAEAGYDAAELDVQLTRDDRLIVFHDFRLKPGLCRTADGEWVRRRRFGPTPSIRELNYSEVRNFEVGRAKPGGLYARRHPHVDWRDGVVMPSLAEVIAGVRAINPGFRLFIEIKTALRRRGLSAPPEAVAEAVLGELHRQQCVATAVLVGFDWRGLVHAKKRCGTVQCWFSTLPRSRRGAHQIADSGGDGWFCPLTRAKAATIESARASGLRFGVWTVNRSADMQRLIARGVDGICTDRPDRLRQVVVYRS